MQATENLIYSEKQKVGITSLLKIIIPPIIVLICMGIGMFYYDLQGVAYLFIPFGIVFVLFFFLVYKTMWLSLELTNKGLTYTFFAFKRSTGIITFEEIKSIQIMQYPKTSSQYGKRFLSNGARYTMTEKRIGVEIVLKNGKTIFFTAHEPEELVKSIRRLDPKIEIIK
jgi:hypothetical protein